jgi:hypothetical protein
MTKRRKFHRKGEKKSARVLKTNLKIIKKIFTVSKNTPNFIIMCPENPELKP